MWVLYVHIMHSPITSMHSIPACPSASTVYICLNIWRNGGREWEKEKERQEWRGKREGEGEQGERKRERKRKREKERERDSE